GALHQGAAQGVGGGAQPAYPAGNGRLGGLIRGAGSRPRPATSRQQALQGRVQIPALPLSDGCESRFHHAPGGWEKREADPPYRRNQTKSMGCPAKGVGEMTTFKAGLEDIVALRSEICFIDGQRRRLVYRGYDIGE